MSPGQRRPVCCPAAPRDLDDHDDARAHDHRRRRPPRPRARRRPRPPLQGRPTTTTTTTTTTTPTTSTTTTPTTGTSTTHTPSTTTTHDDDRPRRAPQAAAELVAHPGLQAAVEAARPSTTTRRTSRRTRSPSASATRRRRPSRSTRPSTRRSPAAERGRDHAGDLADAAAGAARGRAEPVPRLVPDPAVPAADLPGGRDPVPGAVAGARRDQRDRDRLRPQPVGLLRGRRRLDAVHAGDLEGVGHRRQRRRRRRSVQPGRRDLQRRPLPAGGRRRDEPVEGDLRLQPRGLVRQSGAAPRQADRRDAAERDRRAHRSGRGPLPRRRRRPLLRRLGRVARPSTA